MKYARKLHFYERSITEKPQFYERLIAEKPHFYERRQDEAVFMQTSWMTTLE